VNATEDRLSAAGRAVAVTVPPASVPPLRLPGQVAPEADPRRLRRRWPRGRRPGWLAPLAAAAAVVTMIALSVAVARGLSSGAPGGTAAGPLGTPTYYVALADPGGRPGAAAVVRRTATGLPVARVAPPGRGSEFTMVAAGPDDRTFVLASGSQPEAMDYFGSSQASSSSQRWQQPPGTTAFYLLRFDPARRRTQLSRLQAPLVTETVSGLTLSPDGKKLAVATARPGRMKITVSTLAAGTSRTWTGRWSPHLRAPAFNSLSWTNPSRLAFVWWVPGSRQKRAAPDTVVRLLDLTAPGTSLDAASTEPVQYAGPTSTAVSPQGVQIQFPARTFQNGSIAEYPTGQQPVSLLRRSTQGTWQKISRTPHALWISPAGTVLIASIFGHEIDVIGHGRIVKLPGTVPANPFGIAW